MSEWLEKAEKADAEIFSVESLPFGEERNVEPWCAKKMIAYLSGKDTLNETRNEKKCGCGIVIILLRSIR